MPRANEKLCLYSYQYSTLKNEFIKECIIVYALAKRSLVLF